MDAQRGYEPITGNPRRRTRSEEEPSGERAPSKGGSSRKARVSVTPRDPDRLEAVAEELGLPKSKVYNVAFQALLEKLERK